MSHQFTECSYYDDFWVSSTFSFMNCLLEMIRSMTPRARSNLEAPWNRPARRRTPLTPSLPVVPVLGTLSFAWIQRPAEWKHRQQAPSIRRVQMQPPEQPPRRPFPGQLEAILYDENQDSHVDEHLSVSQGSHFNGLAARSAHQMPQAPANTNVRSVPSTAWPSRWACCGASRSCSTRLGCRASLELPL